MTAPLKIVSDHGGVIDASPTGRPTRTWPNTHGMYVAGRAYLDEADMTAADMEAKWGAGRLRRLVAPELREKFDRQRYLLNQAVWHGELEQVRRESGRMVKAWLALDRAATEAGAGRLDPTVWEVVLEDGSVAAIVPDTDHARMVVPDGRRVNVYTLEEIGRLLSKWPELAKVKAAFPGAEVTAFRRLPTDPLDEMRDSQAGLDDPLANQEIPF